MRTVHEVSQLTGVSIRTLQYYDNIGLLRPAQYTEAGYRLYDDAALETLQQILLFRELEFPLKEIREIIGSPGFDREKAIDQQIELLRLKKEHLENLITLAREIQDKGEKAKMDFKAFDRTKLEEYARKAKAEWGTTPEYQEYEKRRLAARKRKPATSIAVCWTSSRRSGRKKARILAPKRSRPSSGNCRPSSRSISIPVPMRFSSAWGRCTLPAGR